jgi:hypothetical protein
MKKILNGILGKYNLVKLNINLEKKTSKNELIF